LKEKHSINDEKVYYLIDEDSDFIFEMIFLIKINKVKDIKDFNNLNLTEPERLYSLWQNFMKNKTYPLLTDDYFPKKTIYQQLHSINNNDSHIEFMNNRIRWLEKIVDDIDNNSPKESSELKNTKKQLQITNERIELLEKET